MYDDVADYDLLKEQLDRITVLYMELEQRRSEGTLDAVLTACRTARGVDNPRYGYALEQVRRIERAVEAAPSTSDLATLHETISRLKIALRSLIPRASQTAAGDLTT